MQITLEDGLRSATEQILDTSTFVRAVLSGRRRNMQVGYERIDIRLVEIKGVLQLQRTWLLTKLLYKNYSTVGMQIL
jgi:hypothetical protein